MADSYQTERYRLKSTQEKQRRDLISGHVRAMQAMDLKHKAELQALKAAHVGGRGLKGRPIVPRPDPDLVRGHWAGGLTAAEMAIAMNTTKARIYEALATLPQYHEVWALLKEGLWMSDISNRTGLPMTAIQAVKLSVRTRGRTPADLSHMYAPEDERFGPKGTKINLE